MVPVRYPLSEHSWVTLGGTVHASYGRDAELTVFHVDLYQSNRGVTRTKLKRAVEAGFEPLVCARCIVCRGFFVKETILEEVATEGTDIVIIGSRQASCWRRMLRRFLDDPDIDVFPREELDYTVIIVHADD